MEKFDSNEYSWKSIQIKVGSKDVRVERIVYSGYSGHIFMEENSFDALNEFAKSQGDRDLLDISFDIEITYKSAAHKLLQTIILKDAEISSYDSSESFYPFLFISKQG